MKIEKTYIYVYPPRRANGQTCPPKLAAGKRRRILCQHDGNDTDPRYFYLHDRLGNVRQIIDANGAVVKQYTYNPFGQTLEESSDGSLATSNGFMFTGLITAGLFAF